MRHLQTEPAINIQESSKDMKNSDQKKPYIFLNDEQSNKFKTPIKNINYTKTILKTDQPYT